MSGIRPPWFIVRFRVRSLGTRSAFRVLEACSRTPLLEEFLSDPLVKARRLVHIPMGRLAEAQEIADAVLYLAHARSVTGQLLFVDAGASMQSYERDFLHLAR